LNKHEVKIKKRVLACLYLFTNRRYRQKTSQMVHSFWR